MIVEVMIGVFFALIVWKIIEIATKKDILPPKKETTKDKE